VSASRGLRFLGDWDCTEMEREPSRLESGLRLETVQVTAARPATRKVFPD